MIRVYINDLSKDITVDFISKLFDSVAQTKSIKIFINKKQNDGTYTAMVDCIQIYDEKKLKANIYQKNLRVFIQKDKQNSSKPKHQTKAKQEITHIANPSFYFYKDKAYGKDIDSFVFDTKLNHHFKIDGAKSFELTSLYPGVLVGSGYAHPKLKSSTDDYQLGFFFDHTTGLPLISGSSIKGLIRSVFPQPNDKKAKAKESYIKQRYLQNTPSLDVDSLFQKIFEDKSKVIFYDAYITATSNDKAIFGSDYITTHHSNQPDGIFQEPIPIKFLKILPDVTFCFQFKADDELVDFFKKVIIDFGIGAKTNVGYGRFVE